MGRSPEPQYEALRDLSQLMVDTLDELLIASALPVAMKVERRDALRIALVDLHDAIESEWCERP